MDIRQIVRTVRANWLVALVTFLVCLLIGVAYAVLPAKVYQASVVLLAQPPPGAGDPGSDVGAISTQIPQIAVVAENASVGNEARAQVPVRFRSLPVTITATGDPSSNSVTINASSTDPVAAQAFANATATRVLTVTNRDAGSYLVLSELGAAELPTSPTNPSGTVIAASLVFGLIAAVFAALAAGALRRTVAADEIAERLGVPVLGEVPTLVRSGSNPVDLLKLAEDGSGLEAFQQLRSHLHVMFQGTYPVMAFTSCGPREGKTCVAAHAAWVLATPGQFVVAVDADLRQPALHRMFGAEIAPGVSDIAFANGPGELLTSTGNRYLELIPAGIPTRHPTDIAAADIPRLLRALQESDRTVVLDCPPITGIAETTILAAKADAVILVVDARNFNFETLEHGLAHMRDSGADVIGIVLNRVRRRKVTAVYRYRSPRDAPPTTSVSPESSGFRRRSERKRDDIPASEQDRPERARQG